MLVAFPIGLLALTPLWDGLAWTGIVHEARAMAYYSEVVGLGTAGFAIIAGFADLMKIPQEESATARAALIHAALALVTVSIFGIAFALRGGIATLPRIPVLVLDTMGALCLALTGWFGGDLVFHRGVGVVGKVIGKVAGRVVEKKD